MFGLGLPELIIILVIILILFGRSRIPQLGSSLGQGIKNFTRAFSGKDDEDKDKKNSISQSGQEGDKPSDDS